jgi:hypothetical protein
VIVSEILVFGTKVVISAETFWGLSLQEARKKVVKIAKVTFDILGFFLI